MRRLDRSGLGLVFSSSSRRRDNITGTTTRAVTRCFSMSVSTVAGLNRLRSTNVLPSIIAMVACRKPSAWNIGAGSDVSSPDLNGTCDSTPPIGASDGGLLRLAPLGVPVVPLVRMMILECAVAFGGGSDLLLAIRSASVSSLLSASSSSEAESDASTLSGLVGSARSLPSSGSAAAHALVYSSSWMISFAPSRSDDLLDLRTGEFAVEQDQPHAHLGGAVERDEEPAVVADQQRDPIATLDADGRSAHGRRRWRHRRARRTSARRRRR